MKRKFAFFPLALLVSLPATFVARADDNLLQVNCHALVAHADLDYSNAVTNSEAGLPVGNGRMGSLVWTTPAAIHFQINRVDVFGNGCASDSFPQRNTDYCGGCGFVDVDFAGSDSNALPAAQTRQHLSCYDGLVTVEGGGVQAEILAWNEQDVLAIRITDHRPKPGAININLRMLRPPFVRTVNQTATSKLDSRDGNTFLTQQFVESNYYCGSAVAVGVVGRDAEVRAENSETLRLVAAPGDGSFTIYVASAASFNPRDDLAAAALAQLRFAGVRGFDRLLASNRAWWANFWSKSFIALHSADGVADNMEKDYDYYLYLMASTSRGKYPTKFNGMLWTTGGDRRQWGGDYWGANQSCIYNNALFAANHAELLDPMFDMYSGMLKSCELAARQQWGSRGAWLPETVSFDGLAPLPDNIAAEMRKLYLMQEPWTNRSKAFVDYASTKLPFSSRWNWIGPGKWVDGKWIFADRTTGGPFGPVTHTFARGAKIAYQYWLRYEYTGDQTWLRDRAYPVIRDLAEFYRNFPNVKKEADGLYHINHVNSNESVWGARDTDEEISGMRGILPIAIAASKILNVDAGMRPVWQEFLDHLAPLPTDNRGGVAAWIRGSAPGVPPRAGVSGRPDGNTMPMWFFDLCTLESDPATFEIGSNTFNGYVSGNARPETNSTRRAGAGVGVLSKVPLVAATMGRTDAIRKLLPLQFTTSERGGVLANRMDEREGPQTTGAEPLGNASDALHTALCGDLPAGPGQPSVIRIFEAWPKEWDAAFQLLCRGGFLVSSQMKGGEIPFVQINSQLGGECRLRNPWGEGKLTLYRNGQKMENVGGSLLMFDTRKGETILMVPENSAPPKQNISI